MAENRVLDHSTEINHGLRVGGEKAGPCCLGWGNSSFLLFINMEGFLLLYVLFCCEAPTLKHSQLFLLCGNLVQSIADMIVNLYVVGVEMTAQK